MRAGQLRQRVTFQGQAVGRDSFGSEVVNWTDLTTVWAAVEPLSGSERYLQIGDQFFGEGTILIRVRYSSTLAALTPKHRGVMGERIFDIQHIMEIETRRREIHVLCKEEGL